MRLHWLWRVLAVQYAVTAVAALLGSGEGRAMQELQRGLHVPESAWPAWEDPCTRWQGVVCVADHVDAITLPTVPGNQSFYAALDALRALPFLRELNASGFPLRRAIPYWLPTSLQTLDLSSCALTGAIPTTIGTLSSLKLLSLKSNNLSGPIPPSLGAIATLTTLNLSFNNLSGNIPDSLFNATSLLHVDLSHNNLTGALPPELGNLTLLAHLDISHNFFSGAIPTTFSNLKSLTFLALATNNFSGKFPEEITTCTNLGTLNVRENRLAGVIPETIGGLKNLVSLDVSSNRITGLLPLGLTTFPLLQTMDVSHNYLYGPILEDLVALPSIQSLNVSFNFFNGSRPMLLMPGAVVKKNCLIDSPGQHTFRTCSKFYYKLGLVFGAPPPTYPTLVQPPEGSIVSTKSRHLVPILAGVLGGVGLIFLIASLVFCVHFICGRAKHRGSGRTTSVGSVRGASARATAPASVPTGRMGEVFSYAQLQQATKNFSLGNLISNGHSGDLYKGLLDGGAMVAVKRIDLSKVRMETYLQELEVLGRASHTRLVLLLGHCLERDDEKFLVYKYTPNGDLASALHKKGSPGPCEDVLQSLDWITRLKIAIGVAEALSYLHSECSPPIVHRDVKASSILLDDKFEVRLGSLSDARVQDGDPHPSRITRLLGLSQSSDQGDAGAAVSTSSDVYNFGKVLLELVSGKLGISGAGTDPRNEAWLEWALPLISVHDKESLPKLVDPSLIVDEDLLEEVWAMAIIARACLHSKPHKRPSMRHVLKALENPHKVVREENFGESLAVRTSSHSSWNEALFGSWRHNHNNNNMSVFGSLREDAIHGSLPVAKASGTVASSSGREVPFQGHARRGSSDIVPEPIDEEELPHASQ